MRRAPARNLSSRPRLAPSQRGVGTRTRDKMCFLAFPFTLDPLDDDADTPDGAATVCRRDP